MKEEVRGKGKEGVVSNIIMYNLNTIIVILIVLAVFSLIALAVLNYNVGKILLRMNQVTRK